MALGRLVDPMQADAFGLRVVRLEGVAGKPGEAVVGGPEAFDQSV